MASIERGPYFVVCQRWEESEAGWGVRPDGFSLHVSTAERDAYVRAYWGRMPTATPAEYERPSGDPYGIGVSLELMQEVVASARHGLRYGPGAEVPPP